MVRIDDFHISFDKRFSVYDPGEVVTGNVEIRTSERVYCDRITAQCYGSARVFWVDREVQPPHGLRSVTKSQEKFYFDLSQKLWEKHAEGGGASGGSSSKKMTRDESVDKILNEAKGLKLRDPSSSEGRVYLTEGSYRFPFSFQLPERLPTSFDANHSPAYIRYAVKVILYEEERVKYTRKEYFTVVKQFDLNTYPKAREAASKTAQRIMQPTSGLCCLSSSGPASLMVTLQKIGYVPGEPLKLSAELDNGSGASFVRLKARLMQHVVCYADTPAYTMKESSYCVANIVSDQKVLPGATILWENNPSLYVPAVVPTFTETGIVEVSYSLVVDAYAMKENPSLTIQLPILVGTVPVVEAWRLANAAAGQQAGSVNGDPSLRHRAALTTQPHREGQDEEGTPPTYEEAMDPPEFQQSVLGRCETQGSLQTDYLPRYAVYNFPSPLLQPADTQARIN